MKSDPITRFHLSAVGYVADVATQSPRKLRALGVVWVLVALLFIVLANYLLLQVLASPGSILSGRHQLSLVGSALLPLIGWFSLGSAVQRFHASKAEERFLRSGPGGISVSVPDHSLKATLFFSFRSWRVDLPWDEVKNWYPFVQSMNGIPTERSIVFETQKGEKISVKTYNFAEKQKQIAGNIDRARLISPTQAEQRTLSLRDHEEQPIQPSKVPSGILERQIHIEKKKDLVKEIDLRSVPARERGRCLERVADLIEQKLASLFPLSSGYKCSRKRYRPFRERKSIFGIRFYVRRGLLEGYEIQLAPNDSEYRRVATSICRSNRVSEIRKYISISFGISIVLLSFRWLPDINHWLGEFARLTPIVMFGMFLAAAALCAGVLQVPISFLQLFGLDKQKEEAQKRSIEDCIKEAAI